MELKSVYCNYSFAHKMIKMIKMIKMMKMIKVIKLTPTTIHFNDSTQFPWVF